MRCSLLLSSMLGCLVGPGRRRGMLSPSLFDIQAHYTKRRVPRPGVTASGCSPLSSRLLTSARPLPGVDDPHAHGCGPMAGATPGGLHLPSDEFLEERYGLRLPGTRGRYVRGRVGRNAASGPVKRSNADVDESSDAYDSIEWMLKHLPGQQRALRRLGCVLPWLLCRCSFDRWPPGAQAPARPSPINDIWDGDDGYRGGAFDVGAELRLSHGLQGPAQPDPGRARWVRPSTWTAGDDYNLLCAWASGRHRPLQKDNRYLQELTAPDRYDAAWQACAPARPT